MPSPQDSYSDSEDYLPESAGPAVKVGRQVFSGFDSLPGERCLEIYRLMVRTRALEERTIKMSKSGEGYFWVGGPGEEAFNVCLGLQVKKGRGPAYDYLHLHYRNAGVMLAMGMPMLDHTRQMAMTAQDRHSLGRNFVGHYSAPEWNVVPVTSVVSVQYVMAPGTALMQKRFGGDGVSIVIGGDAGSAEGDFSSCMVWSTRPGNPLPVLMVVTNNGYGISTPSAYATLGTAHLRSRRALRDSGRICRRQRSGRDLACHLNGHSTIAGRREGHSCSRRRFPDCTAIRRRAARPESRVNRIASSYSSAS